MRQTPEPLRQALTSPEMLHEQLAYLVDHLEHCSVAGPPCPDCRRLGVAAVALMSPFEVKLYGKRQDQAEPQRLAA